MLDNDVNDEKDEHKLLSNNEYSGFHIINSANAGITTKIKGSKTKADKEFEGRITKAKSCLTQRENLVMTLIGKGLTFEKVGKKLDISQPAVSQAWASIKTKLKGV